MERPPRTTQQTNNGQPPRRSEAKAKLARSFRRQAKRRENKGKREPHRPSAPRWQSNKIEN